MPTWGRRLRETPHGNIPPRDSRCSGENFQVTCEQFGTKRLNVPECLPEVSRQGRPFAAQRRLQHRTNVPMAGIGPCLRPQCTTPGPQVRAARGPSPVLAGRLALPGKFQVEDILFVVEILNPAATGILASGAGLLHGRSLGSDAPRQE